MQTYITYMHACTTIYAHLGVELPATTIFQILYTLNMRIDCQDPWHSTEANDGTLIDVEKNLTKYPLTVDTSTFVKSRENWCRLVAYHLGKN